MLFSLESLPVDIMKHNKVNQKLPNKKTPRINQGLKRQFKKREI